MKLDGSACIPVFFAAFVFTGCQSPSPLSKAERIDQSLGSMLVEAAPTGSPNPARDPREEYRNALADLLPDLNDRRPGPDFSFEQPAPDHAFPPGRFVEIDRAVSRTAPDGLVRNGAGLPVIGRMPGGTPNAPRAGFLVPATLVALPEPAGKTAPGRFRLRLLDPFANDAISIGGQSLPIAYNLEAVIEKAQSLGPGRLDGWKNFLNAHRLEKSRLTFFQPFDPDKIPVVLVHGLFSTPQMWADVARYFWADPALRDRFQFWMFYYPTGQPIPVSAFELRRELDAVVANHGKFKPVVLIGHSMGGILARAQVSRMTPEVAEGIAPGAASLQPDNPLRRALVFDPRTDVRRVVFMMAPHRGSRVALTSYSALGMRITRFPRWLGNEIRSLGDLIPRDERGRLPTSIHGLSPGSRFLAALDKSPIHAPFHSIIGIRNSATAEGSSDGVVTYESAHLEGAESEVLVPAGHGSHAHPAALAELHRILSLEK